MTALPYYAPLVQDRCFCKCICDQTVIPGQSAANNVLAFPTNLNSVAFVGNEVLKLATYSNGEMPLVGFVVPPLTRIFVDYKAHAQFDDNQTLEQADLFAFFGAVAGELVGDHAGTTADPLIYVSPKWYSLPPDGPYGYATGAIGRSATGCPPVFSANPSIDTISFNNTESVPYFVSLGVGGHEFNLSATITFTRATVDYSLYKLANYLISNLGSSIVPTVKSTLTKSHNEMDNPSTNFVLGTK